MNRQIRRALVAGGAGFLGSHLCERLLAMGKEVFCIDNLSTGYRENLSSISDHERFHFLEADICEELELPPCEEIYNLACPASPKAYQRDPIQTLKTNVIGTLKLLEQAKKAKAKFFHASTSEIYGDPLIHPQEEGYWGHVNPVGVRSCYDEGKRCSETLCFDFIRLYRLPIKVARIFNTYGPRMDRDDGRVISNFIVQALEGKPLTIYGEGSQTRSFCYVDDLIDAIVLFMESPDPFTGPLNLGNPQEWEIVSLAKLVLELTGSNSQIVQEPLPSDDPRRRRPDISLANKQLQWTPKIDLQEGLVKTIQFFKENIKISI